MLRTDSAQSPHARPIELHDVLSEPVLAPVAGAGRLDCLPTQRVLSSLPQDQRMNRYLSTLATCGCFRAGLKAQSGGTPSGQRSRRPFFGFRSRQGGAVAGEHIERLMQECRG